MPFYVYFPQTYGRGLFTSCQPFKVVMSATLLTTLALQYYNRSPKF